MANPSPFSQKNPHFFQPLLSGFQSHLKIPVKFFNDHIEGKKDGDTVKLISDASDKTWKVKMEGQKLTEGWKEFVEAHNLEIGDFVVFRHEGNLLFHVTALGSSCCEIQYTRSNSHSQEEDEESDEIGESLNNEKETEENSTTESDQSSSDLNIFSQSVTASNLSRDFVGVPSSFAKRNGFNKESQEIVLMNEEGESWESELKSSMSSSRCRVYISRGWTSFCSANDLQVGDSCTFKLFQNAETTVFRLCSRTNKIRSAEDNIVDKTRENRFVKLTPTPNSLQLGKQYLPVSFTRENRIVKPGKITLMDKNGGEWSMGLKSERVHGSMYIMGTKGWKSFCVANGVAAYESLTLELIRGGTCPLLKFCSKVKMEQLTIKAEARGYKRARVQQTKVKHEVREKIARTWSSNKSTADLENVQHTRPCSISDQLDKMKRSVIDNLTSITRFRADLETMEQKLEDSLQEIDNLERRSQWE